MQLHLTLNLNDAQPLQPRLTMSKLWSPVYGFHVMMPVQKLRRLSAADSRGGPLGALSNGGSQYARKSLTYPGAASSTHNRGEAVGKGGWGGSSVGRGGGRASSATCITH